MKLTRRLVINVGVFLIASILITVYGVVEFFGSPLDDPDQVTTELAHSAGLRKNFSVSHNGIVVGVISNTELTETGVLMTVTLHDGVEIPRAVQARVVRASPVGEQRLELEPVGDGSGPLLADGDVVPGVNGGEPPVVSEVVDELVDLIEAVPPEALNTVIEELSIALDGRADDIALFIESSTALNEALLSNEEDFRRLLDSAPAALDTLNAVGDDLETSLANSVILSRTLADNSDELVSLLRNGQRLADVGGRIVDESGANLVCLTSDLADLSELLNQPENLNNIDQAFRYNFGFFGPINNLAPQGPAKDLGLGTPKEDQVFLRVSLQLPSQQPAASANVPSRSIKPVRPGAACNTVLGAGATAPTQDDPDELFPGGTVEQPTAEDAQVRSLGQPGVIGDLGPASVPGAGGTSAAALMPLLAAVLLLAAAFRATIVRRFADFWVS